MAVKAATPSKTRSHGPRATSHERRLEHDAARVQGTGQGGRRQPPADQQGTPRGRNGRVRLPDARSRSLRGRTEPQLRPDALPRGGADARERLRRHRNRAAVRARWRGPRLAASWLERAEGGMSDRAAYILGYAIGIGISVLLLASVLFLTVALLRAVARSLGAA